MAVDSEPIMGDPHKSSTDARFRLLETEVKHLKDKVDLLENTKHAASRVGGVIVEDAASSSSDETPVDSTSDMKRTKKKRKKKSKRGTGNVDVVAPRFGRHAAMTKVMMGMIPIVLLFSLAVGQGGMNMNWGPYSFLLPKEESGLTRKATKDDEGIMAVHQAPIPSLRSKKKSPKAIARERLLQGTDDAQPTVTIPSMSSSLPPGSSRPSPNPSAPSRPLSLASSSSLFSEGRCPIADNTVCGCEVLAQRDYRGTINTSEEGPTCAPWDADFITQAFGNFLPGIFPDDGLDENFCRNPGALNLKAGCVAPVVSARGDYIHYCDIPMCAPCSCMPVCGQPNPAACGCPSVRQADECCDDVRDANSCKCGYLKKACSTSLENGSEDFCDLAEEVCCKESKNPDCGCNLFEQMCSENPSEDSCEFAAERCCPNIPESNHLSYDWGAEEVCKCEFFEYVTNVIGFKSDPQHCNNAVTIQTGKENQRDREKIQLDQLYLDTGGEYWFNNEGWADESDSNLCNWYGVTCNDQDYIEELNLRNNNLTGDSCWTCRLDFEEAIRLDLSQNQISMERSGRLLYNRKLEYIDMSENVLTGHLDALLFPSTKLVNFSHNQFTSADFKRFRTAYNTLQVFDISSNYISQDVNELFLNIPPALETLDISNNGIGGSIQQETGEQLLFFAMSNNSISGPLPDFPNTSPKLRSLNLRDNQLTGTIWSDVFKLADLSLLDLASNNLSSGIPSSIGDLSQLKELDLSNNGFVLTIPQELGKLADVMEMIDLSTNALSGRIPSEFGSFQGDVLLGGNNLTDLAPLDLCLMERFDGINDTSVCPLERNALHEFYVSAKGIEWTRSELWVDAYESHCKWYGVDCKPNKNGENVTYKLNLTSNGLSGTLSKDFSVLKSIKILDLADNDLKGNIPTEIGLLSDLSYLRLSYNNLVGTMPMEFQELSQLKTIQLQSNRISGAIPLSMNAQLDVGQSTFISDCGVPTMFENVLICSENCTMCCNSQDDCYPTANTAIQEAGYEDYLSFTWVFFLSIIGASCVLHLASFLYGEYKKRSQQARSSMMRPSAVSRADLERDKKYALDSIGKGSVYMFFLGNHAWGWLVALSAMAAQIGILYVFVEGAEFDLSDDISDLVYTWKCPRDKDSCRDTNDLNWRGWVCFGILMTAHLLKDIVNGSKLIVLSGKQRHSLKSRIRFFFGGMFTIATSLFALFVTTVYNQAIAASNTALIENSVIVLFITDLDEMMYSALLAINPSWVARKETEGDRQQQQTGDAGRLNKLAHENEETMNDDVIKQMQIEIGKLREMVEQMKSAQHEGDYEGGKPVTAQDDGPSNEGVNLATAQDEVK